MRDICGLSVLTYNLARVVNCFSHSSAEIHGVVSSVIVKKTTLAAVKGPDNLSGVIDAKGARIARARNLQNRHDSVLVQKSFRSDATDNLPQIIDVVYDRVWSRGNRCINPPLYR